MPGTIGTLGTIPSFVGPSTLTFLNIGREATMGVPVLGTVTVPLDKANFSPEDTPRFLPDEGIRGVMSTLFNEVIGPEDATFSFGGPNYLSVHGYFFDNLFGDLASQGSVRTNNTSLNGATLVGAQAATLTTMTGYTVGSYVQIGPDTGSGGGSANAEIVIMSGTAASNTIQFTGYPLRFPHTSGATVATVTGPFTHTFAILNLGNGQPPTHTLTDYTGLTGQPSNPPTPGARSYPSACVSAVDFTGNAEQLLDIKITGNSWLSRPASSKPTAQTTYDVPVATWHSTVSIGGTPYYSIGEWTVSFKRQLQVYWTAQGAQTPYIIARGGVTTTGTLNFTVPQDESQLLYMLNNTTPAISIFIDNGRQTTDTLYLALKIQMTNCVFIKSKPDRNAVLVGFQNEFECITNNSDDGGSGGMSPGQIQLINWVPTY